MRKEFIFTIVGVFVVLLACCLLVALGMSLESSEASDKQTNRFTFLSVGVFLLICGMIFLSAGSYRFGKGNPRSVSDMTINHIYEVIGRVSVGEQKIITVLKEQSGKMRLFEFKIATKAKFIKVIGVKGGKNFFQTFPPSEETSQSKEASSSEKDS